MLFKEISIIFLVSFGVMWFLGYFAVSHSTASALDYGFRQLNLLALINSSGWSYFLPEIQFGNPSFEGYSFLGLGILILIPIALFLFFKNYDLIKFWPNNIFTLTLALLMLTIFARTESGYFVFPLK